MVRKIKTEKVKKKNKVKKFILVLLFIIVIGGLSFFLYKKFDVDDTKPKTVPKVLSSLDGYNYTLTDKDSSYYKSEFEELKKILNNDKVDEKAYAAQVAKMFVIDLYSMKTKINNLDVGGYEFYYAGPRAEVFAQKVVETIYSQLEDNTYGDRKQELPLVKEVKIISSEEADYRLGKETVFAYKVKLNITYEKDMGYDTEGTVMVCKEDGMRWSVVDYQPTLEPDYSE
ncbi:MAG TPA: hypothetical protein DCE23_08465 [Firmicutes bacterium]|nr:hypothetical protein [Bacillota bacterium]